MLDFFLKKARWQWNIFILSSVRFDHLNVFEIFSFHPPTREQLRFQKFCCLKASFLVTFFHLCKAKLTVIFKSDVD